MITAIVLYDLPDSIGLEECRAHFAKIAPDFLRVPGFVRKQFICRRDGKVAGGAYMWESQEAAEREGLQRRKEQVRCFRLKPSRMCGSCCFVCNGFIGCMMMNRTRTMPR